ncbi:Glutamine-dependent NAD(+) synthetase [Crateriforma conspicua]|uniref:Glutamine-dependent NAD(+) synthetase n=1 Tax=Crateriforma conspicua TaxID=2527996 RepID=A0A5C6FPZ6_9PLAN|nr:NAD(+) synthase [Crateriforma conspicua]TWU63364.1 Glutamine-dependent NAD(+) synthetase [Crateriforma conspicua]
MIESDEAFPHGIFRIAAASPRVTVAQPSANVDAIESLIHSVDADLILLPELALTGYTCGDLFAQDDLLRATADGLSRLIESSSGNHRVMVVGLPWRIGGSLMNVAAVIQNGQLAGMVPKSYLPTYREFYEGRHFRPAGDADPDHVSWAGRYIPFGTDLLFQIRDAVIGIEICEDFWTPVPPSSHAAVAGANVLLNLSASNETIGKATWRRDLVTSQSGRCIAAYAYASSGRLESTSDLVFGGHCLIAENGTVLTESRRIGDGRDPMIFDEATAVADVDLQRLAHDRQVIGSFDDLLPQLAKSYRRITLPTSTLTKRTDLLRRVDAHPFVPDESAELDARCAEIFAIQTAGLAKRLSCIGNDTTLSIGVSGGLDSTLALLVAVRACQSTGRSLQTICGITMPGFGTTTHTKTSADRLIDLTGIRGETIDIRPLCLDTFLSLGHQPLGIAIDDNTTVQQLQDELIATPDDATDLVFENVQARVRTMLLMNRGFVLGTGDMSEQALGWSTYNADHMSMYNVNTSIPKTLVRFLVRYAADHYFEGELRKVLHRIADTPISPELLPPAADGTIRQSTEQSIGAYELHDFFLYHFVRNGFSREKILHLAGHARFDQDYAPEHIATVLDTFLRRFFANQFKRNCVPDGPKVGSVSLSPRGDWRMPSDGNGGDFRDPSAG